MVNAPAGSSPTALQGRGTKAQTEARGATTLGPRKSLSRREKVLFGVFAVLALPVLALFGSLMYNGKSSASASPTPVEGHQPTANVNTSRPSAGACASLPIRQTLEMVVCSGTGGSDTTIPLVSASGETIALLQAGTQVKLLARPDVTREEGHVDSPVCVASGDHAGAVGYVQNIQFFVNYCE
jgi:hypothetical protein